MVTKRERLLIFWFVRLRIWRAVVSMRCIQIVPRWGTRWLFNWIRKRQAVDDLHHAPCCPANHWHKMRLVFKSCTCGAQTYADETQERLAA